jgi:hypothetical protein
MTTKMMQMPFAASTQSMRSSADLPAATDMVDILAKFIGKASQQATTDMLTLAGDRRTRLMPG